MKKKERTVIYKIGENKVDEKKYSHFLFLLAKDFLEKYKKEVKNE